MKILNLYAGIGGNRKLWGDEHDITAVEINEQIAKVYTDYFPNDTLIIGDAHNYLLEHYDEFDFIWSSPPCPTHSRANYWANFADNRTINYPDMKLWQEIILLKHYYKGKWTVENVVPYYEPLVKETKQIGRHLFWANFMITGYKETWSFKECDRCIDLEPRFGYDLSGYKLQKKLQVLRNTVQPETGLHILNRAMDIIEDSKVNQITLF